ncbi:ORF79 [Leucania separata nucleopolyhedrovirus]|uniref:ORF79 n=1 Tax=Leucania separata nucleopolyhedrovirus TaxID=1307956 RepID=Q0IL40_NPVLS|nr:ORF79 [Leucania separata nucleopolyhedrovirus]AAR28843.1 ORF79 [Leucania separata nucleopolyhedrovirus]
MYEIPTRTVRDLMKRPKVITLKYVLCVKLWHDACFRQRDRKFASVRLDNMLFV